MSSTAVNQALAVLASLTLEEKLGFLTSFTADFAKSYTKDVKKTKKTKASAPETEKKPRKTAAATYAWLTYEKEVMRLEPELFVGIVHVAARRKIVSDYKKEHEDHYAAYVKKYKEDLETGLIQPPMSEKMKKKLGLSNASASTLALISDSSDAEVEAAAEAESEVVSTPAEAAPSIGKVKAEEMKKKLAEKKEKATSAASESSSNAAPTPTPAPEKKKKSVVKKAKPAATEAKPEEGQEFITVDGKNYIRLLENNGCFVRHDNGTFGAWEGVYDEETNTLRKTASPSDV